MESQAKTSQLVMRDIRNYEISVWTLQDDFITVLKHSNLENKGQIQDGEMTLNVDGTQELSFSIPLYYSVNGVLTKNPLWDLYKDGVLAANLKKLKVIMNKNTPDVEIYELMILRVTERHEKNELYCDVECEGLAFQELGKQGYKISLSSDDFFAEDLEWFQEGGSLESQPVATLQYWCNKFLQPYPETSSSLNPKIWYYQVKMDWSAFSTVNSASRDSSKVYEDEFIGNWTVNNDTLVPGEIVEAKEKARLVDLEESNIYNLTQDLAETFGIYCRYEFDHDDQYHITGRKIVFYNNFFEEEENGAQDITYKYNTTSISRTLDSTDLVTKMYVRPVDDDISPSGLITIMDVDANKSKEDYLLNFDYLHDIGAIDDILYNEVPKYEAQMREINTQIVPLSEQLIALQNRLPAAEAKLAIATNAIQLDKERISAASALLNNLTGGTGVIPVTKNDPDMAVLMETKNSSDSFQSYYIKISKQGVIPETLKIYRTLNFGYVDPDTPDENEEDGRLTDPITTGQFEYDEFGNLVKVINLYKGNTDSRVVYLTYNYSPKLYYERVINTWTRRLALDTADQSIYSIEVLNLNISIELLQNQYNTLLAQKAQKIKDFEQLMGPALREGYWQPDDYIDYGDNYADSFSTNLTSPNTISTGSSGYTSFIWDPEPFEDEQLIYEKITAGMSNWYYPTVDLYNSLTNISIREKIINNLDRLSFLYYDNFAAADKNDLRQRKSLSLGSGCQLGFVRSDVNGIHPILILNGAINELDNNSEFQCYSPALGILTPSYEPGDTHITIDEEIFVSNLVVAMSPYTNVVYPRIQISALNVKTSEDKLSIKINNHLIKNYEDFYILYKESNNTSNVDNLKNTYITLKPEALIKSGLFAVNPFPCEVKFSLSNADTEIYLDAIQVLKDSSVPQVSYDLKVGLMQKDFIRNIHRMLNRIVHINDYELRFDHVQGYVSEVVVDLDRPWEDTIKIKNYTTKFEDLFAKIVASTEAMKKTQYLNGLVSGAFTQDGYLTSSTVKNSLRRVDLNYAFNNGTLTIDEKNGIWGVSDAGVVAFRGGGIFTATEKDSSGNWIWNTGIVPQGINADLIVSGQIDTNRIRIYAGDRIRFQLNGDGLFAYKSFLEDFGIIEDSDAPAWAQLTRSVDPQYIDNYGHYLLTDDPYAELDPAQYVVLEENGLFLKVEEGAYILNSDKNAYIQIGAPHIPDDGTAALIENSPYKGCWVDDTKNPQHRTVYTKTNANSLNNISAVSGDLLIDQTTNSYKYYVYQNAEWQEISEAQYTVLAKEVLGYNRIYKYYQPTDRVAVTWDGLTLRNYFNETTFFADADTGNLYLTGTVFADEFFIKNTREGGGNSMLFPDYLSNFFNVEFEDHVKVSESLAQIFEEAGEILSAAGSSLNDIDNISLQNSDILNSFKEDVGEKLTPKVTRGLAHNIKFKPGDIWEETLSNASDSEVIATYVAMAYWDEVYNNEIQSIIEKQENGETLTTAEQNKLSEATTGTSGWTRTHDYSLAAITGANLKIDAEAGTVDIEGQNQINIKAGNKVYIGAKEDVEIVGNKNVKIGGSNIYISSYTPENSSSILGGIHFVNSSLNSASIFNPITSRVDIDAKGIELASSNGINIKSGAGITIKSSTDTNVAVLNIDNEKGIWMGSDKEINFFSGNLSNMPETYTYTDILGEHADALTTVNGIITDAGRAWQANQITTGASVKISPERLLFGVSNIGKSSATVVDLTDQYIILGAGNQYDNLTSNSPDWEGTTQTPVSGMKITKDGIWMATGSGNNRGLIALTPNELTLGVATNDNSGSFIKLSKEQLTIGASSNLYINANNIALDSTASLMAGANYESSSLAEYKNVAFRLGSKSNPSLVLANNNLAVKGTIRALDGWIGSENNGWKIKNGAIFSSNGSVTEPSEYDTVTRLGSDGIYLISNYQIWDDEPEWVNPQYPSIYIKQGGDTVFSVEPASGTYGDNLVRPYIVSINTGFVVGDKNDPFISVHTNSINDEAYFTCNLSNVILDDDLIQSIAALAPTQIYTAIETEDDLPDNVPNGTLGVVFTEQAESSSSSGTSSVKGTPLSLSSDYVPRAASSTNKNKTYFGLRRLYWNVTHSAAHGGDPDSNRITYARAGVALTDNNYCAAFGAMETSGNFIAQGSSYTINFNYALYNGSDWDIMDPTTKRAQSLNVDVYTGDPTEATLVGHGTLNVPVSSGSLTTTDIKASVDITFTEFISTGTTLYVRIYSSVKHSLIFVNVNSFSIGGSASTVSSTNNYSLWIRSNNSWCLAAQAEGGTSTMNIPVATTTKLGGVKIGSGITISQDGTISIPTATRDVYGLVMPDDVTIKRYTNTNRLYVPVATSSSAGIIQVDTSNGLTISNGVLGFNGSTGGVTYSAGNGININSNTISVKLATNSGLTCDVNGLRVTNSGSSAPSQYLQTVVINSNNNGLVFTKQDGSTVQLVFGGSLNISNNSSTNTLTISGTSSSGGSGSFSGGTIANDLIIANSSQASYLQLNDSTASNYTKLQTNSYGTELSSYLDSGAFGILSFDATGLQPHTQLGWLSFDGNILHTPQQYYILHTGMKVNSAPAGSVQVTCYYNSLTGQFAFV